MTRLTGSGFWNSANTITVARIVVVPVVMALLAYESVLNCWIAAFLYIAASISDIVDGYLARKYNLVSIIGAFLDPLADKLLVIGALVMLVPLGRVPAWMAAVLIMRDVTITALRGIAASEGLIISASKWGKYKTTFLDVSLCFLIAHHPLRLIATDGLDPVDLHTVGMMFLWPAVVLSLWSGAHYLYQFFVSASTQDETQKSA